MKRPPTWKRLGLLAGLWILALPLARGDVPREDCFPLERLPTALRHEAEALLLEAMDREALYTIVGGLKPMSGGWGSFSMQIDKPSLERLEACRLMARSLSCGEELTTGFQPFARVFGGKRHLDFVIFHRARFRETIAAHPPLFGYFGLSPSASPVESLLAIDRDPTPKRSEAYGLLFGYPEHAVRFFSQAETHEDETGEFVKRDFFSIPVVKGEAHYFVYAVPQGYAPQAVDLELRQRAAPILNQYRELREQYIGDNKRGIVALIRDWFDDGTGRCSPQTAVRKAQAHEALSFSSQRRSGPLR